MMSSLVENIKKMGVKNIDIKENEIKFKDHFNYDYCITKQDEIYNISTTGGFIQEIDEQTYKKLSNYIKTRKETL